MILSLEPARYESPAAFHAALEARLRAASGGDAYRWTLMRTQFAISRLLVRLQLAQPGEWVAKGGTSLLARLDGRCRLSRDLDLQRRDFATVGEAGLRQAADADAGDWLRYRVEGARPLRQDEFRGARFRMSSWIGVRQLARFGVDIIDEAMVAGQLEQRAPYSPVALAGASNPEILLYPVEDHVADKLAAMGKVRQHGDTVVTSTRYRDLADLALLATSLPVKSAPLLTALELPARHWARDTFGDTGLRFPDPEWPDRYAGTIHAEPFVADRWPTAEGALAAAKPLVDPALAGTAIGTWDPVAATWRG